MRLGTLRLGRHLAVRLAAASAIASLAAACATAPSPPALRAEDAGPPGAVTDASVYGLYLAGEAALDQGENHDAAFYLGRASAAAPDSRFIQDRAFAAALIAGEVDRAAALAPSPSGAAKPPSGPSPTASSPAAAGSPPPSGGAAANVARPQDKAPAGGAADAAAVSLGLLTQATVDLAEGRGRQAYARLSEAPNGEHSAVVVLLKPWAAAAAGDESVALAAPPALGDHALADFGALGQAMLLERAGHFPAAEAAFKTQSGRGGVFALAYGGFLERRGRRVDALALYDTALTADPTDPAFLTAKARASAGRAAPPQPTIRQGAAQLLVGPAALLLSARQTDAGLAYLRLALKLDPKLDEAWVLVGDAEDAAGDAAAAREAYARVEPGSAEYPTAQDRTALSLQTSGDKAGALKLAQAVADANPGDPQALVVLADILRDDERYDEAVKVLDRLIAQIGGDTAANWRLYYLRGASLERAGHWASAQADLQHAVKLKPDDPEVLNYLGFAWADRGEHLDQALLMLQKAMALDPQDGAIVDSLGWVHYRLGDYQQALRELELAVSLDAADPEVNDHLGDVYWRTGRRIEARYQWRRVLTLDPDAAMRAADQAKLAGGLPSATTPRQP